MRGCAAGGGAPLASRIEAAFRDACFEELEAPKPGNVHVFADGHRMTVADFRRSAEVAAPALGRRGAPLGRRILDAVAATRAALGCNTNLGIVLLCAPLARAAEMAGTEPRQDLAAALRRVLDQADLEDAAATYRAIAVAAPGGLGDAGELDVRRAPAVPLAVAMGAAAERDLIARQWASGFASVFGIGLDAYGKARARWGEGRWAALAAFLRFASTFPDSHVARKHGATAAECVRRDAVAAASALDAAASPETLLPRLLAWDAALKRDGLNPGTSADLTVATCFAWRLRNVLQPACDDG